jgi:hypothetical protein
MGGADFVVSNRLVVSARSEALNLNLDKQQRRAKATHQQAALYARTYKLDAKHVATLRT